MNPRSCVQRFEWHISGQKADGSPTLSASSCFILHRCPRREAAPGPSQPCPPLRSKRAHGDRTAGGTNPPVHSGQSPGRGEHTLSGSDHQLVREDKGPRLAPRRRGTLSCDEAWVGGSSYGVQAAVDFLPGEGLFFPLITSFSCPTATRLLPDTPSRSVPSDRNTV